MAEILNLRQARKDQARAAKAADAAQNRARFGRSKAEKSNTAAEKSITEKIIDAHKRQT